MLSSVYNKCNVELKCDSTENWIVLNFLISFQL